MSSRRILLALLATGLALLTTSAGIPATAGPTPAPHARPPDAITITLITGDQVRMTKHGKSYTATPEAAPERAGIVFGVRQQGDRTWVYPNDAVGLIAAGRLDRRLFEVTALADHGYGDDKRDTIPLILQHSKGKPVEAPVGAAKLRELPSVTSTVVQQDKQSATGFWRWLTGQTKALPGQRSAVRGALAGDVRKVWLDGTVTAASDRSVPQVGAPVAWTKGYTGKGVKVAVLDSGIDDRHLDLKGAIAASALFSSGWTTGDLLGHGTHVASIITGDGTRSGGKYRGVAPDATLLNGKVLDDQGFGVESAVIAGMEWAVGQGAKVVNLSVGHRWGDDPTPMESALNRLSLSSGALFVVPAGNYGPDRYRVTKPAAATEALAVAATNRDQTVLRGSSGGPRIGDYAVKPEISAPGSEIIAARAAGARSGVPVDDHYSRMSGTSMASAHVAGAAAILAQQQPAWNARLLKAALMGTADLPVDQSVFRQGAGFLDVSRAVTQKVLALEGSVSANLLWPHTQQAERTITYRNPGAEPLTLALEFTPKDQNGAAATAGVFSLPSSVTVPPRTTAKVTLTIDPTKSRPGLLYQGRITATATGVVVRTPVSVNVEREAYDVSLDIIDRNGDPVTGFETNQLTGHPELMNLTDGFQAVLLWPKDGKWVARVPRDAYTITLSLLTPADNTLASPTLYAEPRIAATAPIALRFDAREANRATAVVDAADARTTQINIGLTHEINGQLWREGVGAANSPVEPRAYVVPSARTTRLFQFDLTQVLQASDRTYELAFAHRGELPADPRFPVADEDLADLRLALGAQAPQARALLHHAVTVYVDGTAWFTEYHEFPATMPSTRRHLVSPTFLGEPLLWTTFAEVYDRDMAAYTETIVSPARYRSGETATVKLSTAAFSPQASGWHGDGTMYIEFWPFNSSGGGTIYSYFIYPAYGSVVLTRDGVQLAATTWPYDIYTQQAFGTGTYTATMQASRQVPWSNYVPEVTGRWTFTSTDTPGRNPLPIITTRVHGAFDGMGRAPAGQVFPLTLDISGYAGSVADVTMQVSYNDGGSWVDIPASDATGAWVARVRHPDSAHRFVSLRVSVTDTQGDSADWTAYRSYQLR